VVDHEHHRRVAVHPRQHLLVEGAEPHPVERSRDQPRHPCAHREIGKGRERGHDLAGIALDPGHDHVTRLTALTHVRLDRGLHLHVVGQPVDQHQPLGQFEGLDLELEAVVDLVDGAVEPLAEEPAHIRPDHPVDQGDDGKRRPQQHYPQRKLDRSAHVPDRAPERRSCPSPNTGAKHRGQTPGPSAGDCPFQNATRRNNLVSHNSLAQFYLLDYRCCDAA